MEITKLKVKSAKVKRELKIALDSMISRNPEIDATDLEGEVVMMNLDKGQYYMMNEVGSRIWEIIGEPITVDTVIDTLMREFEVEKNECKEAVVQFLGNLKHADLISVS